MKHCFRETNCVRFGRIASLSACVLFAGGCVVRIAYESFLDCSLLEVFLFLEWRTAIFLILLDFNSISLIPLLRGTACPPFLKDALPFCPFGTFPHTVGNHPPRRAEPARPQLPAALVFVPISDSIIFMIQKSRPVRNCTRRLFVE